MITAAHLLVDLVGVCSVPVTVPGAHTNWVDSVRYQLISWSGALEDWVKVAVVVVSSSTLPTVVKAWMGESAELEPYELKLWILHIVEELGQVVPEHLTQNLCWLVKLPQLAVLVAWVRPCSSVSEFVESVYD